MSVTRDVLFIFFVGATLGAGLGCLAGDGGLVAMAVGMFLAGVLVITWEGNMTDVDTAYRAIMDDLETRVVEADTVIATLMQTRDAWLARLLTAEARIAALTVAARAVVDAHSFSPDGVLIACGCPTDRSGSISFHTTACLVIALERLLGDAPTPEQLARHAENIRRMGPGREKEDA